MPYLTECENRILEGSHKLVIGMTGSGKTFLVAKLMENMQGVIVAVNPQEEEVFDSVTEVVTEDPKEVIQLLEDGKRRIQFLPSDNIDTAIAQLETIRRNLFEVAAQMNLTHGQYWANLIIDEAQTFAWKGSRNDIDNLFTKGRRYGIRGWALTQRPQNLSATIINMVDLQVIFQTGSYESMYFKNYHIDIDQHKPWLEQDYHYVLYDGINFTECEPVLGTGEERGRCWKAGT